MFPCGGPRPSCHEHLHSPSRLIIPAPHDSLNKPQLPFLNSVREPVIAHTPSKGGLKQVLFLGRGHVLRSFPMLLGLHLVQPRALLHGPVGQDPLVSQLVHRAGAKNSQNSLRRGMLPGYYSEDRLHEFAGGLVLGRPRVVQIIQDPQTLDVARALHLYLCPLPLHPIHGERLSGVLPCPIIPTTFEHPELCSRYSEAQDRGTQRHHIRFSL